MSRRRGVALVLAGALVLGASEASAAPGARLAPIGDQEAFPQRAWVLTFPAGVRPAAAGVRVRENGQRVRRLRVVPGDAAGEHTLGVVLVIDASNSMHGAAIKGAMAAARSFAARRAPRQRLGVVTFNERAETLLVPTTDGRAIDAALARPPALGHGTFLHDGVARAVSLIDRSRIQAGSVVVLSDGADTGSRTTERQVAALARGRGIRVFGVGLRSGAFDPGALRRLAATTGGTATFTRSPKALRVVFDALGERLANQFVVRYDSQQRGGSPVRVEASADGGATRAVAHYLAPLPGAVPAGRERRVDSFWLSASAVPAVTALCALLLAFAAGLLVRRRPGTTLRERLSSFAAVPALEEPVDRPSTPIRRMASIIDRRLSAGERWQRFAEDVDVARMKRSAAEIALLTGLGGLASAALLLVLGLAPLLLLPLALAGGVLVVIRFRAGRQRRAFEEQLPDNLQVLGSALRAGHSFTGALGTVVDGAPEPIRRELARAQTDEQLGVPIDEALLRVGRRMRTEDVTQVAVVAALQQEAGGNTAEVLDRVVESLRERHGLRRLVRSLTAQGRMSQIVVTALPFGLAVVISLLNPGYLDPLLQTGVGRVLIGGALVMTAIGAIAIKRIVEIKI